MHGTYIKFFVMCLC